jgi:hypothetical protein
MQGVLQQQTYNNAVGPFLAKLTRCSEQLSLTERFGAKHSDTELFLALMGGNDVCLNDLIEANREFKRWLSQIKARADDARTQL